MSGQLLRTARFDVRKKNYLETNTSNTRSSPLWFCPWSDTHKGTQRSLSSKLIYYGHKQGKIPSHRTDRLSFFGSCKLEPVSRTFLSPEKATRHCLTHSEHVLCDLLTPLTLSCGNKSAVEIKSGNFCRFNIDPEHCSHNIRQLRSTWQHDTKVDFATNLCWRPAERSPVDTWMG